MNHLGDITKIHGDRIEPVDVITFGSPCQDLSIAGNRAGLDGERSGLFMEAVRIIKEMRRKTNGRYPTYAVWENVPGAFSSQKGEDFRVVLEELCKICKEDAAVPRPADKWRTSGAIVGDWWSVAWRVFDAQFWGVPQRRRRIALVVDFRGGRAPEILFERKSLRGNFETGEEMREGVAGAIEDCPNGEGAYGFSAGQGSKAGGIGYAKEVAPTIKACASGLNQVPCISIQHSIIGRESKNGAQGKGYRCDGKAYTLDSRPEADAVCVPINDQATHGNGGCNGNMVGNENDPMYSLTARDRHAVLCMATGQGGAEILHDTSPTLNCDHEQPICLHPDISGTICASGAGTDRPAGQGNEGDLCIVQAVDARNMAEHDVCGTLQSKENGGYSLNYINPIRVNLIVRRLTPLECERLQGYPDGWAHIPDYIGTDGKKRKVSNSAMYKALGNSISIPNWKYVMKRIAATFECDATLGSLFDGIGGFPMIWEHLNGKGSAKWAS